ncbi:MAG: AlpA family transcriptional regulator [Pseudomonadota bacterium]
MQEKKRFIKLPETEKRTGYKRASIYKKIKEGKFPSPYPLGDRAVGWLESDIDNWIEERINASRINGGTAYASK